MSSGIRRNGRWLVLPWLAIVRPPIKIKGANTGEWLWCVRMRVWLVIVFFGIFSEAKSQFKVPKSPLKPIVKVMLIFSYDVLTSSSQGTFDKQKFSGLSNPPPMVSSTNSQSNLNLSKIVLSSWGVLGVVMFIANALKRLIPVALQPLLQQDLTKEQIVIYIAWTLYMIYAEGYQAFHLKFSPLVVRRSLTISENPTFMKCLLAGPYCMGLFGASRKRMIVSWSVIAGVFGLVKVVKQLPYPWRSIVDAGVVFGLSVGTLSIIYHYILALFGRIPSIDPDLPELALQKKEDVSL
jgi:hypothetical protein